MLAKEPKEYTVYEILNATEGSLSPVACLDNNPNQCERAGECATLFVWAGLNKVIYEYLKSITLQDILDKQKERYSNDYII